jgi:hypothetical protein
MGLSDALAILGLLLKSMVSPPVPLRGRLWYNMVVHMRMNSSALPPRQVLAAVPPRAPPAAPATWASAAAAVHCKRPGIYAMLVKPQGKVSRCQSHNVLKRQVQRWQRRQEALDRSTQKIKTSRHRL